MRPHEPERRGLPRPRAPRPSPRVITPLSIPDQPSDSLEFPLQQAQLTKVVRAALDEDSAFGDITTVSTIRSDRRARATLVARGNGVLAGVPLALEAFRLLDALVSIRVDVEDGSRVKPATAIFFLSGHARALLSGERVALNFLQRLSGVATLTRRYVDAVEGTGVRIYDTRKTTPGWRALEKYAVRAGGGFNHRLNLGDGVLIKDNHLVELDNNIGTAVKWARSRSPEGSTIIVECDTIEQVEAAVTAGVDIVMLDNMSPLLIAECVRLVDRRAIVEASGGVTLDNVRAIAGCGVDRISVGALTHSAPALDLALDFNAV